MKIYTKKGDEGYTTIGEGGREKVLKDDERIRFLGDIDELNAHIGYVKSMMTQSELRRIQNVLFDIAAAVAYPSKVGNEKVLTFIDEETEWLEKEINQITELLPPLTKFLLPGDANQACSYMHIVRTVCRRTERSLVATSPPVPIIRYINRLSDYFFTLSRQLSSNKEDHYVKWTERTKGV